MDYDLKFKQQFKGEYKKSPLATHHALNKVILKVFFLKLSQGINVPIAVFRVCPENRIYSSNYRKTSTGKRNSVQRGGWYSACSRVCELA